MKNQKQKVFMLIASLLPFLFLILVELFFRLFNLFPQTPLFIENKQQNYITINSTVGERYFNKKNIPVPNMYPQTFSIEKRQNTLRIFCLGGSTTAGFPYEMTVPFPQQLKFLLQENYPEKEFEVINLGLSAINSFTVLDWMPEILKHEPDLVIIYMGHNEFYGAYGTGSAISFGNYGILSRLILKIKKIHLYQAFKSLLNSFQPNISSDINVTLMEKMVNDRNIAPDSQLREKTYKNYSDNLDIILGKLAKKKIPVILSNLVSNLKDQPPLGKEGKYINEDMTAMEFYKKGLIELSDKDSLNAINSFIGALNRDDIPFRAPEKINSIIKSKVKKFQLPFVDMDQAFSSNSPMGIVGDNLFCDHLHPNPVGYHLMAKEFFKAVIASNFLPLTNNINNEIQPKFVTELDWEIGGLRVFILEQKWPFFYKDVKYSGYNSVKEFKRIEIAKDFLFSHHTWGKAHSDIADIYIKNEEFEKVCEEYKAILAMFPEKLDYHLKLIDYAKKINDWNTLKSSCKIALKLTSVKGMLYYNLALAQRNTHNLELAFKNVQNALNCQDLNHQQLTYVFFLKALILFDIKEYEEVKKILEVIIQEEPGFEPAGRLLKEVEKII